MAKRSSGFWLAAAGLLAGIAVACGGAAAPTATPTARPAPTAAGAPAAPAATATPVPVATRAPAPTAAPPPTATPVTAARRGAPSGKLTVAVATLQEQMPDPHRFTGGLLSPMMYAIADGWTRYDQDRNLVGAVASSWKNSPDGMRWDFELKKGVKFHNGQTLTAEDIVYSYNRWKRLAPSIGVFGQAVDHIEATGAGFAVIMKKPYPLVAPAGIGAGFVVPKAYAEQAGDEGMRLKPVAAGPFKFLENRIGEYARYEGFADHYERVPYIKTLELRVVPEGTTRIAMLRTGEADMVEGVTGARVREVKNIPGLKIISSAKTAMFWVQFMDMYFPEDSPVKNIKVREALNISIDRQQIVDRIYFGEATVAPTGFFDFGFGGDPSLKPYPYDPERAKRLLAEAGFPNGLTIDLGVTESSSTPLSPEAVQATAAFWDKIGVRTRIQQTESGQYYTRWREHVMRGLAAQSVPLIDDQGSMGLTFFKSGQPYTYFSDKKTDSLVDQAMSEIDPVKRAAQIKELINYTYNNFYVIPLIHPNTLYGAGPRVKEWKGIAGNPYAFGFEYLKLTEHP